MARRKPQEKKLRHRIESLSLLPDEVSWIIVAGWFLLLLVFGRYSNGFVGWVPSRPVSASEFLGFCLRPTRSRESFRRPWGQIRLAQPLCMYECSCYVGCFMALGMSYLASPASVPHCSETVETADVCGSDSSWWLGCLFEAEIGAIYAGGLKELKQARSFK
jgi:hypothetical protein